MRKVRSCKPKKSPENAYDAQFSGLFFAVKGIILHDLRHEAAHGFRRLILHLPGGVGVGAER